MQKKKPFIKRHRDGSLWAKGFLLNGKMEGYWEFYRLDGSRMGSGSFTQSQKTGDWTTYDRNGRVVRVTNFNKKKR